MENKTIVIKPISKNRFSGINMYPKAVVTLSTEYAADGTYKTGLSKEEEIKLEEQLMLPKGTLSKAPIDKDGTNFWAELQIRISDKGLNLNTELPLDFIKYKVLKQSSKVCNSIIEKVKYPNADFMIHDLEEAAKAEEIEIDLELEAFEKLMETSSKEKKGLLKLYGKYRGLETASDSLIKTTLAKEVKKDPKRFINIISDKNLKTRILIGDLIEHRIIVKKGNYFTNGDEPIGNTDTEVVMYLDDPKNSAIKAALKGKLDSVISKK